MPTIKDIKQELEGLDGTEFDKRNLELLERHPDAIDILSSSIGEILHERQSLRREFPIEILMRFEERCRESSSPQAEAEFQIAQMYSIHADVQAAESTALYSAFYGRTVNGVILNTIHDWLRGELSVKDVFPNHQLALSPDSPHAEFLRQLETDAYDANKSHQTSWRETLSMLNDYFQDKPLDAHALQVIQSITITSLSLHADASNANWLGYHSMASCIRGFTCILPNLSLLALDRDILIEEAQNIPQVTVVPFQPNREDLEYQKLASLRPLNFYILPEDERIISSSDAWVSLVLMRGTDQSHFDIVKGVGETMAKNLLGYYREEGANKRKAPDQKFLEVIFGDLYSDAIAYREKYVSKNPEALPSDNTLEGLYMVSELLHRNYPVERLGLFGEWVTVAEVKQELMPMIAWYFLDLNNPESRPRPKVDGSNWDNGFRHGLPIVS